jgi:uncharacterized protein (DUF849 family)
MAPSSTDLFPLSFCPTGMVARRKDSSFVPLSAEEIAEQVLEAASLGITSAHLHARGRDESPAWEREYFADIIERIRQHDRDLVVCVTTSGRLVSDVESRSDVLELDGAARPDMASLTLSSLNFSSQASVNAPETVQLLAKKMLDKGIAPEFEIFDTGMVNYLHYLIAKGLVEPPFVVNFILGGPATAQATSLDLGVLQARLPSPSLWSAGGIGRSQLTAVGLALADGGGVRVGLEDNLHWDSARSRLATNRELVERVLALGEIFERAPMAPREFRRNWLHA